MNRRVSARSVPISQSEWDVGTDVFDPVRMDPMIALKPGAPSAGGEKRKLRKSCEFCRERKKRCDGDGVNRCRWESV